MAQLFLEKNKKIYKTKLNGRKNVQIDNAQNWNNNNKLNVYYWFLNKKNKNNNNKIISMHTWEWGGESQTNG